MNLDADRMARLLDAGRSLVRELDLEPVLQRLLVLARELTGARYAALGVLDHDRRELERFVTSGVDEATRGAIGDVPRGRGVLGVLIDDPRPLRLDDVGAHPRSYGFPAGHPSMRTFLGVPVLIGGEAWGNLYLTEKEGGVTFDEGDEDVVVVLADWAGIAISNARLHASVQSRRDVLERAVAGLEATTAIARAIGDEVDLGRVLELIVKRGRALVDARALLVLLTDGADLVVAAHAGQVECGALGTRIPRDGTAAGEVLGSGRPEAIDDVSVRLTPDAERLGVRGAETALVVPLVYRGTPLGVLAAFDHLVDDESFGSAEQQLMLSFAASAATAVATAKSVQRERLRESLDAAERERRRWARELHDETLQGLAGLRVLLASALRRGDVEHLETSVRQAVDQIEMEIAGLRALITELRPAALDDLGLAAAIHSLVERVAALEGLEIDFEVDLGEGRLPSEHETAVYRLVQEALSNVVKHADATRVEVHVARDGDDVRVRIEDDGRGFKRDVPTQGFGLVGMRERAALLGGHVSVASSSRGTTVAAVCPVRRHPGELTARPPESIGPRSAAR